RARQIGHTPGFVECDPRHDARVAHVALHRRGELAREAQHGLGSEAIDAWHLLPNQESECIGPIQVARILDLLMLAYAVEAHSAREDDVATQARVVRGSEPAAWHI